MLTFQIQDDIYVHTYGCTYLHSYMHACMYECIQTYIHIDTGIHTCMHTYAQTYKHEHAESVANYEVFVRCAQKAGGKRIRGVKEAQGLLIMGWHHAHLQRSASWARRKQKVCLSWAGTTHIISEAHHEREGSTTAAYHGFKNTTFSIKRSGRQTQ